MSLYIAVEINDETKNKLAEKQLILKQNATGEFEDPTRFHITVRFLAEDSINADEAIEGMKLYAETFKPEKFEVTARDFHKFDQGVMWVGVDNSFPLYVAKYRLENSLIKAGFPLKEDTFDGYTPHITMGYNVKENIDFNKEFDGIPFIVDNISLWNGFKAGDKDNQVYIHNKIYGVNLL